MKIKLSEEQYDKIIHTNIDEEYPTSWDVEEFARLKSFNQRIQYCEKNLVRISSGSSRIVYKIDDTKVLKLAKNKKGLAQNEIEIEFSQDYLWEGLVAKIFHYDENNLWVEMELARKLTAKSFQQITGLDFEKFGRSLKYFEQEQENSRAMFRFTKPESYDEMWENEFASSIFDIIGSYDIPAGDLTRLSTYGIVNRNGQDDVVLIDYGLTKDVYDSYYR